MRRVSSVWFILWGAIGFGTGWSLIGIFQESMFFAYFFAGAIGGATLGLALRDWKRAIVLTLLGSIGFGIGFEVGFIVLYFGEFYLGDFLFSLQGLVGGAIGGAALGLLSIGGVPLGLLIRGFRGAVALAFGGAIGFGIGGGVVDILKQPLIDPGSQGITFWWAVLFMVIQGAIGGAALGAILGYLESRKLVEDRRPRVV